MSEVEQLPNQAPASEPVGTSREPRLAARARVLVIEDEHELRQMIAQWLESKGYEAVEAADGTDAIDLLRAGLEPDAIILDLALPRLSGQDFLAWLRSQPNHMGRPVIVTSGEYDALPAADAAGAEGTLAKPYRPDVLAAELERVLAG